MQFKDIPGQKNLKQQLIQGVHQNTVAHAQLFLGPIGSGNLAIALAYAQFLNCQNPSEGDSCAACNACKKAQKYIHPDIHFTFPTIGAKSLSNSFLPIWRKALEKNVYLNEYEWLQSLDAENKQGNITKEECVAIIKNLSLTILEGKYKVQIIWLPEKLSKVGNVLLKTIEEPPPNTVVMLVAHNEEKILGTIRSRTQLRLVKRVAEEDIQAFLEENHQTTSERAKEIAILSEGNLNKAFVLVNQSSESSNQNSEMLMDWMNICLRNNVVDMHKWVERMAGLGREGQKNFIQYALYYTRELVLAKKGLSKGQLNEDETKFANTIIPVWDLPQFERLNTLFNKGFYYIERNANPKLIFFNLSVQLLAMFAARK